MILLMILFTLHYLICLALFILMKLRRLHHSYVNLFIAVFIPIFGLIFMLAKKSSDIRSDRTAFDIDLEVKPDDDEKILNASSDLKFEDADDEEDSSKPEAAEDATRSSGGDTMMDVISDIKKSIVISDDSAAGNVVPLSEALAINDTKTKRALIIDLLYSNPTDFVQQLFYAKSNGDTEVVHYAATALTEIQKDFDLKLNDLLNKKALYPDDHKLDLDYMNLLEKYIASGLLSGERLKSNLRKFSDLIAGELMKDNVKGRWSLINKKANADLQLQDLKALYEDIDYMTKRWPEREGIYIYLLHWAILKKNRTLINDIISQIKKKVEYIPEELRDLMDFWDEKAC
ncbi:hypothetical protein SAMN05216349_12238 [Oribacterium sp. KHPX15]|uniref:hypothetical protein n=1 Tax=Oribacterium sp. KHPX15 TaxID=1855342 RepID=UPI0008950DDC|nr:hypothetical protein [Oribacterium sp. KHPX15]SEA67987.1 hypothetical protein SAMN05216349_12238 [Oribacterium sp. KHPX15]